jgi:phage repressor protein C with HTH and peptisase S24 domain
MVAQKTTSSEWSNRIRLLLTELKLTQAGLAARLGVSPPTVSRWTQGRQEPTAESYIALGNLAQRPGGVYFWERAGLDTSGLQDTNFLQAISSLQISLKDFQLVAGKKVSQHIGGKGNAVAIPLLSVAAYGDRVPPHENVSLSQVEVEEILLAPLDWCPHPENMISMRLRGDSMYPAIPPDSIIFVDTAQTDRARLHQRLTVVSHRDLGFKVARFQRLAGSDLLVSANHKYVPLDISNSSKWKIFGEVLWWVSHDVEPST